METQPQNQTPKWIYWAFGFVVVAIIGAAAMAPQPSIQRQATSPAQPNQIAATEAPKPAPVPESPWKYDAYPDDMGLGTLYVATATSTNTVQFHFPYQGEQRGRLTLRIHPQHGKSVYFAIERGQFLIDPSDGCTVLLRFDEDKPIRVSASGAADHSTTFLFLQGYQNLVARLKKAKRVRIQAAVYQEGSPVFDFDVTGLEWPPMKKP